MTVVLYKDNTEGLMSAKDVTLEHLDFLRALFAPWCVRGIVNLACAARGWRDPVDAIVVDKGEGSRCIDLGDQG